MPVNAIAALFQFVAIICVAAQHVILLVTAHCEHADIELGIVEFLDRGFDVMDGFPQCSL